MADPKFYTFVCPTCFAVDRYSVEIVGTCEVNQFHTSVFCTRHIVKKRSATWHEMLCVSTFKTYTDAEAQAIARLFIEARNG